MTQRCWTEQELREELIRYQAELEEAGKGDKTVHTYVDRASRFIRWLAGEYDPRG
ncbi:hypothetical protein KBX50_30305 [Micromonospora sp. C51]|uniref:hypothetical protein n=1 Tax=Micromonospora sp. C51 TaxID=2824879 RepID=UPI001B37812C|nr:hypothetical protein [Micromonospora sp. C51]MBQ1052735.1 hypothetical protein [Micromonospora sp. C51]